MRELLGPEAAKIAYTPFPPPSIAPCCDSDKESTQLIVGVILIHLFLFYVILGVLGVYLMLRNCAQSRNHEETSNGLTMGVVQAIQEEHPTLLFSAGMKMSGEAAECSICLLEFVEGESIRVLRRCKHGFHVNCIQPWLSCHSSCPTCRTNACLPSPSSSPNRLDPGGVNEFPGAMLDTDSSQRGPEQV